MVGALADGESAVLAVSVADGGAGVALGVATAAAVAEGETVGVAVAVAEGETAALSVVGAAAEVDAGCGVNACLFGIVAPNAAHDATQAIVPAASSIPPPPRPGR
ncbi:hypothetical protein AB4Y87_03970 [Paenarthrobacter sp. RAF54_2]|uniref:hypothetical protein n=1 Tax=Paenarthrobacter sp. RAF54_2 TaxID=3233061 RepID=UPI003F96C0D2